MIEVIERYTEEGVHAEIVGGKRTATISPAPAFMIPSYYTNSIHATRNWWTKPHYVPAAFFVRCGKVETRVSSYDRAVEVAIHHAKRKG